jgi:hypothetical protein
VYCEDNTCRQGFPEIGIEGKACPRRAIYEIAWAARGCRLMVTYLCGEHARHHRFELKYAKTQFDSVHLR